MRAVLWIAVALSLPLASATAETAFHATHAATAQQYQAWIDGVSRDKLRPVAMSAYNENGAPRFNAVAVESKEGVLWRAKHGLDSAAFQKAFDELAGEEFRLTQLAGYLEKGELRLAGLWVKGDGEQRKWASRSGITADGFQKVFDEQVAAGLRPMQVVGYAGGDRNERLAGIFLADNDPAWLSRHGQTAEQYQQTINDNSPNGYRVASLSVYPTASGPRFAVVLIKDATEWKAHHGLSSARYQELFNEYQGAGFRPLTVAGYETAEGVRFAAAWIKLPAKKAPREGDLPTTGAAVPALAAFDAAMQRYMRERSIPCGTLAVSYRGKLVLARGYGHADREGKRLIQPEDPFRLASVSKPITAAAVRKLARDGKLALDEKVFPYLGIDPPEGFDSAKRDARLDDVTVSHLLLHQGGWDRNKAFDPMFRVGPIARELKVAAPAGPRDAIRYMLARPLEFSPGSRTAYSNFGYCVLGRVIEKASGKGYAEYVRDEVMKPLGAASYALGRTLPAERDSREPYYSDPGFGENVFDAKGPLVPGPDGSFCLETMDSHGGWIGSAPDLIKFMDVYHLSGELRKRGDTETWTHFGSLAGTYTLVHERPDGIRFAALFNQRADESKRDYAVIKEELNRTCDGISIWP